jgi:hypothetical protein
VSRDPGTARLSRRSTPGEAETLAAATDPAISKMWSERQAWGARCGLALPGGPGVGRPAPVMAGCCKGDVARDPVELTQYGL